MEDREKRTEGQEPMGRYALLTGRMFETERTQGKTDRREGIKSDLAVVRATIDFASKTESLSTEWSAERPVNPRAQGADRHDNQSEE